MKKQFSTIKQDTDKIATEFLSGSLCLNEAGIKIWELNKKYPYRRYYDVEDVDGHWYQAIVQALPDYIPEKGHFVGFAVRRFRHYILMSLLGTKNVIRTPKKCKREPIEVTTSDSVFYGLCETYED